MTEHQLPEDEVIATFKAEDEDSGAFGQVRAPCFAKMFRKIAFYAQNAYHLP